MFAGCPSVCVCVCINVRATRTDAHSSTDLPSTSGRNIFCVSFMP